MFRKPRTEEADTKREVLGRSPTPPGTPAKTPFTLAIPPSVPPPKIMAAKTKTKKQTPLPTIGRQGPSISAKKVTPKAKITGKGNSSILSFFKRADGIEDGGLFVQEQMPHGAQREHINFDEMVDNEGGIRGNEDEDEERFNESGVSVKRRRTSGGSGHGLAPAAEEESPVQGLNSVFGRKAGPFFEESDSEQEEEAPEAVIAVGEGSEDDMVIGEMPQQLAVNIRDPPEPSPVVPTEPPQAVPALIKENTTYETGLDDFGDFGEGDFDEDPFEGGDEFRERRYMEEQARLEEEDDDEKDYDHIPDDQDEEHNPDTAAPSGSNSVESTCPICSVGLGGISEQDAGVHVNNCLDGNPTPLPGKKNIPPQPTLGRKVPLNAASGNQFKRPVRSPREGQPSPFTLGQPSTASNGRSAFTKLMSGHAEDAAWAEAAAAEHASRGKPAYTRTCPFYKILPGLFICVDAFRYGAVKGCNAYFLSHFHSDHYIGLTSSWRHGPIYCSKVTANLVKQQLRVDPQYVVALDWEKKIEIPGTKGVTVTMISANHCPGSSLFLYEKVVSKTTNGEPRQQRILHCGDFRACRMHVQHPLLMPNVLDKVTGRTKEQKIDVCYLDTTYLNPKYAFPEQEAVIKACADMCVCLSKDAPDETDGWEQMKVQRAGKGMAKFVKKESRTEIKEEPVNEDDVDNMKVENNPYASQQILSSISDKKTRGRLLVVVGTYSIGKERICLGIARALGSKIYAPTYKQRIVTALEDPELDALMTTDPRQAQVHMTPLSEMRAETLDDYLRDFFPHFTRAVGFRPSGWQYRPPNSRFVESPLVQTVLHSENWKSTYSMKELAPQRGSTSRASCFGVPYSEHSSFRELTMFCCALRIEKIIPTVNIGSAKSRDNMKAWCERWAADRKKNGLYKLPEDGSW